MRRALVILLAVAAVALVGRDVVPCGAMGLQPRCYVALYPGPTEDTLRIVDIAGARSYSSTGELLLTTVAVDAELDPLEWVTTAFSGRVQQVSRSVLYPPGTPEDEVRRQNIAQMDESQVVAAAAALRELGHEVDLDARGAEVVDVSEGLPADGVLRPHDVIVSIDGRSVADASSAVAAIDQRGIDDEVRLGVLRDGDRVELTLRLAEDPDHPGNPAVGALLQDHIELPVDVRIDAGQVGGPSAGLMFALAVIDRLVSEDLTGGRVVAGTGTIDLEGRVGAIGGIPQKVLGAVERAEGEGASVFLVPRGNLDEARRAPVGSRILLVPVGDLGEALEALRTLRRGGEPRDAIALGR